MRYVYGPVKSRRLGLSLGISLIPHKTCNFDCVYCQLGRTVNKVTERKEYVNAQGVIAELKEFLFAHKESIKTVDYISFSGSGEPTLNTGIAELIRKIKEISSIPVAVITNSSQLVEAEVRQGLLNADLIVPSLDAAVQDVFEKINQPADKIKITEITKALINLRNEFKGKIWLEIMLVKGINDGLSHIRVLKEAVERIKPDKVQLNSPVRSVAYSWVEGVDKKKLEKIKEIFGDRCEII